MDKVNSNDGSKLFYEWYVLDRNAVPEEYGLRPLKDLSDQQYCEVLPKLLIALDSLEFQDGLLVGDSVTEYEVRRVFPT